MPADTLTQVTAIVGAATGVSGLVLGIVNLCRQMSKDKVRIRVVPEIGFRGRARLTGQPAVITTALDSASPPAEWVAAHQDIRSFLLVKVANMSTFAVTLQSIGLLCRDGRAIFPLPVVTGDDKPWPRRLEPREEVAVHLPLQIAANKDIKDVKSAFIDTACGLRVCGKSKALTGYISRATNRAGDERGA